MAKFVEMQMFYGERLDVGTDTSDLPSMTRQEFADECDVNMIMKRYESTPGGWPFAPPVASFVDFAHVPDNLQDAMSMMMDANEAFMRLPANARREFDNDPIRFVEYAADPENLERLRGWGLAEPEKAVEPPMRVEVVNPAPVDEKAKP